MHADTQKKYLFRALDAFKRRIFVVSPEFRILAASGQDMGGRETEIVGKCCHEVFNDLSSPCEGCPLTEVLQSGKPALRGNQEGSEGRISCLYSYPIFSRKKIEALVIVDFDLPIPEGLDEGLQRSSAFLRNLILSSVDGVIAADRTGKILIFNDAAAEVCGYSVNDALSRLNIGDIILATAPGR